ncbi:4a-hydroxytetrahydrobiopterin dehydratase [Candidatus Parcubacteria bacterium]|nr:4a-hydroxytetrahydrobiopterin dehydratase [Candidatus Parcubacteria bacterium]
MENLQSKKCIPCEKGTAPLDSKQIQEYVKNVKAWKVVDNKKIEKNFQFIDFRHALTFINEVGDVAEFEGHHPDLNLHNWNKVTVTLSTHSIKGLSENDFIMAAKIDQIIQDNLK